MARSEHGTSVGIDIAADTAILVVDDLPEKLLVYNTILERPGLRIVTARSGADALRAVLQGDFAVILLDVSMPGMDGFETAQLIRQRKRSAATPIIFLTAFTDDLRMAQGYASGAVDYIPTPVVPEILRAKVQVFVELFETRRLAAKQAEERARRIADAASAKRSAFLSATSAELSQALDIPSYMDTLVNATLTFSRLSILLLIDAEKPEHRFRVAWTNGDGVERSTCANLTDQWWNKRLREAMSIMPIGAFTASRDAARRLCEGAPELDSTRVITVPISARGSVRGVLALAGGTTAILEDPDLFTDLGSRAGVALENVLLVEGIKEAHQRKDEFLAMLAHELRNPLAPMRNAVDLLGLADIQDPVLQQAYGVMDRQVMHMSRLVDDLLDATRIARGKVNLHMEPLDIRDVLEQVRTDQAPIFKQAGLRFEATFPAEPLYVKADATRLAQCIGNLLHNAHKFTPRGGHVWLRAGRASGGQWAWIDVEDTGVGIDPAMVPHVFDQFRQGEQGLDRGRGGLGLGLTLVKGLAELHGGEVEVIRSARGKGTLFQLRLPLVRTAPLPAHAPYAAADIAPRHILLIDDNVDATVIMRAILERDGHRISVAHTGPNGVAAARELRPEVIICDIGLPGMSGYEVAKDIMKEAGADWNPAMIALSGYGREDDQVSSREAGFRMHLTKPVDRKTLRQVIADL